MLNLISLDINVWWIVIKMLDYHNFKGLFGSGSGGRISWGRNSTFSGGQIFDHEIKIQFVHEIKFFCKIDQEIELALGALRELG